MSIYYLPIKDNIFDGLYKKIIEYDNDIYDKEIEYFPRELLIECFRDIIIGIRKATKWFN